MADLTPGEDRTSAATGLIWLWKSVGESAGWRRDGCTIFPREDGFVAYRALAYDQIPVCTKIATFEAAEAFVLWLGPWAESLTEAMARHKAAKAVAPAPAKPACERCAALRRENDLLREIIRINALRWGAQHEDVDGLFRLLGIGERA